VAGLLLRTLVVSGRVRADGFAEAVTLRQSLRVQCSGVGLIVFKYR
jgi:hypothetical protein